jgi:hypothetical protein
MKTLVLASFALPLIAVADTSTWKFQPSFSFPKWENLQPSLSLSGQAKQAPLVVTSAVGAPTSLPPATAGTAKIVSAMPIAQPPADIDPKMVHAPDATIDFKLIVKPPRIEPAK